MQCFQFFILLTLSLDETILFEVKYLSVLHSLPRKIPEYIIIIIKKGRQCKAETERYTPYQSEDPSATISTYRQKEEKGKKSRRL